MKIDELRRRAWAVSEYAECLRDAAERLANSWPENRYEVIDELVELELTYSNIEANIKKLNKYRQTLKTPNDELQVSVYCESDADAPVLTQDNN